MESVCQRSHVGLCVQRPIQGPLSVINVGVSAQTKQTAPCHKEKIGPFPTIAQRRQEKEEERELESVCLFACLFIYFGRTRQGCSSWHPHHFHMGSYALIYCKPFEVKSRDVAFRVS